VKRISETGSGITRRRAIAATAAAPLALWPARPAHAAANRTPRSLGVVEFDKESDYSHIRVRKQGDVQTLLFVRDHGEEVVQSMVNLKKPYDLLCAYCRTVTPHSFWKVA